MIGDIERRLSAKETADLVELSITNLKHYASLLEFNGLEIHRNTRNHREYTQHDVKIIRAMIKLNKDKSMSLEDAASKVTTSDFPLDEFLSPVLAKNDANEPEVIRVVSQDSEDDSRELAHYQRNLSQALNQLKQLQLELQLREKERIEYMQTIDDKLNKQAIMIEEQAKAIAEQTATIEALRKSIEDAASSKPSLWKRLFGK